MGHFDAVEQVFGTPDTWTVRPRTFGEMNPATEMPAEATDDDYPDAPPLTPEEAAYNEAMAKEYEERGELAGTPREMECYGCAGFDGVNFVMRKVVALGPIINRADPTQTYKLECGHQVI